MKFNFFFALALVAAPGAAGSAPAEVRETHRFQLYKFQQPIGVEESIRVSRADGGTEIRTTFSFTDRRTTVPLAALLSLGPDGTPTRFQVWGSTSRWTKTDDLVTT